MTTTFENSKLEADLEARKITITNQENPLEYSVHDFDEDADDEEEALEMFLENLRNQREGKIDVLLGQLEEMKVITSANCVSDTITINYSSTMDIMEKGGYTICDCGQLSVDPASYLIEGQIIINIDDNGFEIEQSSVDVYSCRAEEGQGDWDGFQIDTEIREEYIVDYLMLLLSSCRDFQDVDPSEEIKHIDTAHTKPNDDYRDSHLHVGQRGEGEDAEYFFCEGNNHLSHNHLNERKFDWIPADEFDASELPQQHLEVYESIIKLSEPA